MGDLIEVKMIGQKSVQEYRKLDILSSSDLRTFSIDRRKFYKNVILKEGGEDDEDYNKSLLVGDIVHTLILEKDKFDERYFLSICPEPPTGLMLAFTEALYKYTVLNMDDEGNMTKDFDDIAREAYSESGFKITLDAVLRKFADSNAELYYKELREARTNKKTVVCIEDLTMAEKAADRLRTNQFTCDIFSKVSDDRYLVLDEFKVEDFEIFGLRLKAMIDKTIIDTEDKTIDIYDIKCIWNPPKFYREYYLKRRAFIQAVVYREAIKSVTLPIDLSDYWINYPTFVVADSSNFYDPIKYSLSEEDYKESIFGFEAFGTKYEGTKEIIENVKWCQDTQNWKTSMEIFDNQGFAALK